MNNILLITQAVLSALLVGMILVQSKGTGFGRAWGSSGSSFTRRGLERLTFRATFVVTALFLVVSILQVTL